MTNRSRILLALFISAFGALLASPSRAQDKKWSLGVNLVDIVDLGTFNLEAGIPLSRHASLSLGGRFNPWQFERKDPEYIIQDRKISACVGVRYWPWIVFSGFWVEGKAQYTGFEISGIWRPALESGHAAGLGTSIGYSFILGKHLNLDLGAGFWGGYAFEYKIYNSSCYDTPRDSGPRWFIFPDNLKISFVYIF